MNPFSLVRGHGRKPQDLKKIVPNELIVLSLRDRVSQKDQGSKNVECLQELTMAITCLKNYGFNEESCENEIKGMQKCFHNLAQKDKNQQTVGKQIPPKVALKLLERYPNI